MKKQYQVFLYHSRTWVTEPLGSRTMGSGELLAFLPQQFGRTHQECHLDVDILLLQKDLLITCLVS